jgi:hypothetical protein
VNEGCLTRVAFLQLLGVSLRETQIQGCPIRVAFFITLGFSPKQEKERRGSNNKKKITQK